MGDNKKVLIGVFVKKEKLDSYENFISKKYHLNKNKLYVYTIEGNDTEYMVTFSSKSKNVLKYIIGSFALHTMNRCLFSINALNKLAEQMGDDNRGKNEKIPIDWSKYRNKLMLLRNNNLQIKAITKVNRKEQDNDKDAKK